MEDLCRMKRKGRLLAMVLPGGDLCKGEDRNPSQ